MIPDALRPWLPDGWQGPKEVARIASNLLAALALAQVLGADLGRIGLAPPLPWWQTALLAVGTWLVTIRIGNHQEARARNGGSSSEPPKPST